MNKYTLIKTITCAVLFSAYLTCGCAPKEVPFFDGNLAFEYLTAQTGFGPRNPGSEGAAACRDYLVAELSKTTDRVIRQPFTFTDTLLDKSYEMTNIIASFNLDPPEGKRIMLTAHWDTRPFADKDPDPDRRMEPIAGANDGASGVAVLLQTARILKEFPPSIGIDIVLFDGEDYGEEGNLNYYCLGSKYFTRNIGAYRPVYAILLDLVGDKDLRLPKEGNSMLYAPKLTERIWNIANDYGLSAFVDEIGSSIYDDHLILNQVGIKAVDIIDFDYAYWHTTADTPDKCSPENLAQVGTLLMALIYE